MIGKKKPCCQQKNARFAAGVDDLRRNFKVAIVQWPSLSQPIASDEEIAVGYHQAV
ncbi:MAG: hypothetical protein KGM47_08195 [Acidobacteriota bacterium]|nr:hypothetical protein [Acidobacteriota bacterium]